MINMYDSEVRDSSVQDPGSCNVSSPRTTVPRGTRPFSAKSNQINTRLPVSQYFLDPRSQRQDGTQRACAHLSVCVQSGKTDVTFQNAHCIEILQSALHDFR